MGNLNSVLVLDDCEDLLVLIRIYSDRLCGRAAITAKSFNEVVDLGEKVFACEFAFLDINLGPDEPSGVDAYRWLRDQGFKGSVFFLTGHARTNPLVGEAERIGDAKVLSKPLAPDEFIRILGRRHDA